MQEDSEIKRLGRSLFSQKRLSYAEAFVGFTAGSALGAHHWLFAALWIVIGSCGCAVGEWLADQ